jgi:hypothetical protein
MLELQACATTLGSCFVFELETLATFRSRGSKKKLVRKWCHWKSWLSGSFEERAT